MQNSPLEYLARLYGAHVCEDENGIPSFFVRFPKMTSRELDESLPDRTHPAFWVDGEEQDAIYLGKYKAAAVSGDGSDGGGLYSLPGVPPARLRTADEALLQMRAFGNGASGMTVADRGFLLLLAQKEGWTPGGNCAFGHDEADATPYTTGTRLNTGDKIGYRGWLYGCKQGHTTAEDRLPDKTPTYFTRIRRIGGAEAYADLHESGQENLLLTMNASGPAGWYLGGDITGLCDAAGNQAETDYGYRILDGELQVLPDNDAANPEADLSRESDAWRAILPNGEDDGHTLVAPGTEGTLHWVWQNGKITLSTSKPSFDGYTRKTAFADLATDLAHVTALVRELGLFPTEKSRTAGVCAVTFARGEYLPRRGGSYDSGAEMGLGGEDCAYGRSRADTRYGARMRMLGERR